jgi:hypothetical protein
VARTKENAMERRDEEIHLQPEEASGGTKNHGVRYVLGISMALVILAFILVYMFRSGHG